MPKNRNDCHRDLIHSLKMKDHRQSSSFNRLIEILATACSPSTDEVLLIARCLLVLIVVYSSYQVLRWLFKMVCLIAKVFEPMNYELMINPTDPDVPNVNQDMTTENYCKNLAEVDNTLRFQTKHQRAVTQTDTMRPLDCSTNQPASINGLADDSRIDDRNHARGLTEEARTLPLVTSDDYVYPNGWLPVMESSKVKSGEIQRAIIMGRDVIVTRSLEGVASVLDAYCPHMGVNIGVGGKVLRVNNESCVQCPFHGWTFRATDGLCVRIPYAEGKSKCTSIPKQAQLNTWLCDEVNGFIFIWHHIDKQPPTWSIEQIPELQDKNWTLIGRSCHKTNLDLRDMHENGADMNHFEGIHNDLFVFGGEYLSVQKYNWFQQYARHHWNPNWEPILGDDGKSTHKAQLSLCSWISLFKLRLFDIALRATQIGPACVVLKFQSKWYGRGVLNMYSIPLGGRRTLYVQHIYTTDNYFDRFMAKWVLYGEIKQLERDLFMWNHKKTITNPIFMPEDKIIKRFRLWYSQFYKRKRKITIDGNGGPQNDSKIVQCINNNFEF